MCVAHIMNWLEKNSSPSKNISLHNQNKSKCTYSAKMFTANTPIILLIRLKPDLSLMVRFVSMDKPSTYYSRWYVRTHQTVLSEGFVWMLLFFQFVKQTKHLQSTSFNVIK